MRAYLALINILVFELICISKNTYLLSLLMSMNIHHLNTVPANTSYLVIMEQMFA